MVGKILLISVLTIKVNDTTVTKQNSCDDNTAQVQAQAKAGYKFVRQSDGGTDNPYIVLIEDDITIIAEFAIENTPIIM